MTPLERIATLVDEAVERLSDFLSHCSLEYNDINADSGVLFVGWWPWRWAPLGPAAQAPLGAARAAVSLATETAKLAIRASEPDRLARLEEAVEVWNSVLAQSDDLAGAPGRSIEEIDEKVRGAGVSVLDIVRHLPTAHGPGGEFLIPDTNALIAYPDLASWPSEKPCTVVIAARVTKELDALKVRDGTVGPKAKKVIRQLNEFDRRGNTLEGVKVAGQLKLRELATTPNWECAPRVLDPGLADDEILATALEHSLTDLRAAVRLVTRDRNMKNRARLVGLEVVDPEDLMPSVDG